MSERSMWMARAERNGSLFYIFRRESIVAINWLGDDDLGMVKTEDITRLVEIRYPEYTRQQVNVVAGQIIRFRFGLKKGDYVVTYDPQTRTYWVGETISDYEYNTASFKSYHRYRVKWLGAVSRDALSADTKNKLGSHLTLFKIKEYAREEILNALQGNYPSLSVPRDEFLSQSVTDQSAYKQKKRGRPPNNTKTTGAEEEIPMKAKRIISEIDSFLKGETAIEAKPDELFLWLWLCYRCELYERGARLFRRIDRDEFPEELYKRIEPIGHACEVRIE